MSNIIKMQDLYFSDYDSHRLCQFYYEVLDKPTTPIIHQMSRFWLINKGRGVLKLQGKEYELKPGQQIVVDTGHLAAMTASCQMEIQTVPGMKNKFLGGEGLFNTVITGPGHVWLQTMPLSNVAGVLRAYLPTSN